MALQIIETMRMEKSEVLRFNLHLERLKNTAKHLCYPFDLDLIHRKIATIPSATSSPKKLRLLLDQKGGVDLQASELTTLPPSPLIGLSSVTTRSDDPYLAMKTTQREVYETEYQKHSSQFYDVLFLNEKAELTEASRHNLYLVINDTWYTPPLASGVLPGVMRKALLKNHWAPILEKELDLDDLRAAESVWLSNSVRGLFEVRLDPKIREGEG